MRRRGAGCATAWIALSILAAPAASAASTETQHAFEVELPVGERLEVAVHSRIRTQPGSLGFYQLRGGTEMSWAWRPGVSVRWGYYFTEQEVFDGDFRGGHRGYAGLQGVLARGRRARLDGRILYERFLPHDDRDFNRYRVRTRLRGNAATAPYASHEILLDRNGWRATRLAAGLRWRVGRRVAVNTGYFFELRRADTGPNRHMWLTSVQYGLGQRP